MYENEMKYDPRLTAAAAAPAIAYQTVTCGQLAAPPPRFEQLDARLSAGVSHLMDLQRRLGQFVDRLAGPQPETPRKDQESYKAECVVGKYEQLAEMLHAALDRLDDHVRRLESL